TARIFDVDRAIYRTPFHAHMLLSELHLFLNRLFQYMAVDTHTAAPDRAFADLQLFFDHRNGGTLTRLPETVPLPDGFIMGVRSCVRIIAFVVPGLAVILDVIVDIYGPGGVHD